MTYEYGVVIRRQRPGRPAVWQFWIAEGMVHEEAGFLALSKAMPVMRQSRFNAIGLFDPPYGKVADTLLKLLMR